jgi:hypothetical protein
MFLQFVKSRYSNVSANCDIFDMHLDIANEIDNQIDKRTYQSSTYGQLAMRSKRKCCKSHILSKPSNINGIFDTSMPSMYKPEKHFVENEIKANTHKQTWHTCTRQRILTICISFIPHWVAYKFHCTTTMYKEMCCCQIGTQI